MQHYDSRSLPIKPWNGPPELKPHDWPMTMFIVRPWNGPPELKPHDWESKQFVGLHKR